MSQNNDKEKRDVINETFGDIRGNLEIVRRAYNKLKILLKENPNVVKLLKKEELLIPIGKLGRLESNFDFNDIDPFQCSNCDDYYEFSLEEDGTNWGCEAGFSPKDKGAARECKSFNPLDDTKEVIFLYAKKYWSSVMDFP